MLYSCYCDYDPPEFHSVTTPKARRQRHCDECGGLILPGDRYERVAGKWDGAFDTFDICEHCRDLRVWLTISLPCFRACWAYGSMFEEAVEIIREARWRAPDEAAGLLFGYYRRVIIRDRFNAARKAVAS